jgi:hypothetical protein
MGGSGNHATLFGISGDEETEVAFVEVVDWAVENQIPMDFVEITNQAIAEYQIDDLVTLWYYDYHQGNPMIKCVGLGEILNLVMP